MYEPDSAVRGMQMLSGILNPVFSNDLEMFNRELLDWEHRAQQYEGAHKALATEVNSYHLRSCAGCGQAVSDSDI